MAINAVAWHKSELLLSPAQLAQTQTKTSGQPQDFLHKHLEEEAASVCLSVLYYTGKSAFKRGETTPSYAVTSDILPPT